MKCKFCNLRKKDILFETKTSFIIEGKGHHHGHIILAYKKHRTSILDLTKKEFLAFTEDLYKVSKVVKQTFDVDKLNLALLGNWVPHLHWHIYPRYEEDIDYGQPPYLQWKIMGKKVAPPRIELPEKPLTRIEKIDLITKLKKEFLMK